MGKLEVYAYDNANRLVSATESGSASYQVAYSYDILGNRVEQDVTQGGTTTVTKFDYDKNGNAWADLNSSNAVVTRRLYLNAVDALFARINSTATVDWYLTDHLGSVRGLMNNSGTLDDAISYDGWGNVTSESQPSAGDRYKFTGREFDSNTGLQYNRARYYDPGTGSWISQDPMGFTSGDSNFYRYVANSPTTHVDPSGKMPDDPSIAVSGAPDGLPDGVAPGASPGAIADAPIPVPAPDGPASAPTFGPAPPPPENPVIAVAAIPQWQGWQARIAALQRDITRRQKLLTAAQIAQP